MFTFKHFGFKIISVMKVNVILTSLKPSQTGWVIFLWLEMQSIFWLRRNTLGQTVFIFYINELFIHGVKLNCNICG